MSEFVVYGAAPSPYARAVFLGLEEKGANWRLAPVTFQEFRAPEHLARHPFGRIPVLEHGDFHLYEADAILRYLDRVIAEPALTPADPKAEARMNQICGITDCYVRDDITFGVTFPALVAPRLGLPVDEARMIAAIPKAEICIAEISRLLADRPFMAGDAVSIADLLLAPALVLFGMTKPGRPMIKRRPNLLAWVERMAARPSMVATSVERLADRAKAA